MSTDRDTSDALNSELEAALRECMTIAIESEEWERELELEMIGDMLNDEPVERGKDDGDRRSYGRDRA